MRLCTCLSFPTWKPPQQQPFALGVDLDADRCDLLVEQQVRSGVRKASQFKSRLGLATRRVTGRVRARHVVRLLSVGPVASRSPRRFQGWMDERILGATWT